MSSDIIAIGASLGRAALHRIAHDLAASRRGIRSALLGFSIGLALSLLLHPTSWAQQTSTREGSAASQNGSVSIYLFWTATCPHCARARDHLSRLSCREPRIRLKSLELSGEGRNEAAFVALSKRFQIEPPAVPLIVVGDEVFVGFRDEATTGIEIENKVKACLAKPCAEIAGPIVRQEGAAQPPTSSEHGASIAQPRRPALPEAIWLPGFGSIETRMLSLPVLTLLLAGIDGFNPCAMWVLIFLIGLLIGSSDPVKMWSYGTAFLVTSAIVYFAFLAAWLNLFLFLGSLVWIRGGVGLFALAAGGYYLGEFVRNPNAACPVTSPVERQRIMDRLRVAVAERSFLMAILGIALLAVAVNLIELLCSAGIPALYTQVLALSDLSTAAYYGYLLLYISVFMLDDAVIFVTALLTLRATGLAAAYSRYSQLVGGIALAGVGLLLIFRPEWLAFARATLG